MKEILYDWKLNKEIQKVSHLNAKARALKSKIREAEKEEIKQFYVEMDSEDLYQIFELIENEGVQCDRERIRKIKEKYENKKLRHDDLVVLENLYKSNAKYFSKRGTNG